MFNNLVQNWYVIFGIAALVIVAAVVVYKFYKLPTEQQKEKIENWLLWECVQAQKLLGTGTGQLKLRMVYDGFVSKFKFISIIMSFEEFSSLVDDSVKKMKKLLQDNEALRNYVYGTNKEGEDIE